MADVQQPQNSRREANAYSLFGPALGLNIGDIGLDKLREDENVEPAEEAGSQTRTTTLIVKKHPGESVPTTPRLSPFPNTTFTPPPPRSPSPKVSTSNWVSRGPLSSHPAWTAPRLVLNATARPDTPPDSYAGSVDSTHTAPILTTTELTQSTDFAIPQPIDNIPRTHITRSTDDLTASDRTSKAHKLFRRGSAASRSVLSLTFRNSIASKSALNTAEDNSNNDASSFRSSIRFPRRPLTAVSTASRNAAHAICLPVGNGQQPYCTPDGTLLSESAAASTSELNVPLQRRKSGSWFKRPSSIFLLSSTHLPVINSPTADSSSMQNTPVSSQQTPDLVNDDQFSRCASPESTISSNLRSLDAPPCLPPIGALKGLTGGDFIGIELFAQIGSDDVIR